jgi:predicted ATPase
MVGRITARKALPREVLKHIVSKTDGVPLFLEELTKMVLESGLVREVEGHYELTAPLPPLAIPTTLQDSLIARLDRLSPIKEVAQLGAILGREFSYELLQTVSPLDETTLQPALLKLVEAEVLYRQGWGPKARYLFKHALIQEAAYQSLLKSKRQQYHQKVAQVLEERFAETCETQPELLAHHYTEAGLTAPAIPYWQRAGERAVKRSATAEAAVHLSRGLALLRTLPPTPEHAKQELALQLPLGVALMTTRGYAATEVMETYTRARELCEQIGEIPQLFRVVQGLAWAYFTRAEYRMAKELGEQLLTLAQNGQDPALLAHAHHVLGGTLFFLGEFASAHTHLMRGIALYDSRQFHSDTFFYGTWVGCLGRAALALWYLGYPDQALQKIQQAIALPQVLSHPYILTTALHFAAWLHLIRGEAQAALERVDAEIAICRDQGWPLYVS